MPLSNLLVILGVASFLLVLAMFPSFRNGLKVLLGGFLNLFIEDTAKSPKGAAAIFDKAIEEAQDKYNKADDTLRSITGRLDAVMKQRDEAARLVKEYEEKARRAMAHGREDDARLYAEKRQDAIISYDQYSKAYEQLIPVVKQAKDKCILPDGKELSLERSVTIERKEHFDELAMCYTSQRERFTREFERAKQANAKIYLLVEKASWEKAYAGIYRSQMSPQSLIASMTTWLARYNCSLLFCQSETSGKLIRDVLIKEMREHLIQYDTGAVQMSQESDITSAVHKK